MAYGLVVLNILLKTRKTPGFGKCIRRVGDPVKSAETNMSERNKMADLPVSIKTF